MMARRLSEDLRKTIALKRALSEDGWRTPDTYCNHFAPEPAAPGVYLFLLHLDDLFERAQVAYVGMSTDIRRRWSNHEILKALQDRGYAQRWFKPVRPADLRKVEASYITKFNPAWNIVGKPRGLIQ